jgi:hypothetical protein
MLLENPGNRDKKAAKALGLHMPLALLIRADELAAICCTASVSC